MCPYIDPAILLHIPTDVQNQPVLMGVIVNTHPGSGGIIRTEKAVLTVDDANQIKSRIAAVRFCLTKAEGINGADFVECTEIKSRTGRE